MALPLKSSCDQGQHVQKSDLGSHLKHRRQSKMEAAAGMGMMCCSMTSSSPLQEELLGIK